MRLRAWRFAAGNPAHHVLKAKAHHAVNLKGGHATRPAARIGSDRGHLPRVAATYRSSSQFQAESHAPSMLDL